MKPVRWAFAILAWVLALMLVPAASWPYSQREEERLGREYANKVEAQAKLVTDEATLARVNRIGQAIAKTANEQEIPAAYGSSDVYRFDYRFKIIEDKDVNAFSLPGGIVYVNTGLLEVAESDDELAAVLAHEIAHAAHHHMGQLLKKQSKVDRYIALITLAGILGNLRNQDLNNLVLGAQLLKTGKLSGYTQEAEQDADRTAVAYLAKSGFDPEGMLSFMRKLDAIRDQNPTVPLGIYQTHPAPFRRVTSIAKAMRDEGLEVDIRKARDLAYAKAVPVEESSDRYRVVVGTKVVWEPACLDSGTTSKDRAEASAQTINALLDAGLDSRDLGRDSSGRCLVANKTEILKVQNEDVQLNGDTDQALLDKARSGLIYAIWADWLCDKREPTAQGVSVDLD